MREGKKANTQREWQQRMCIKKRRQPFLIAPFSVGDSILWYRSIPILPFSNRNTNIHKKSNGYKKVINKLQNGYKYMYICNMKTEYQVTCKWCRKHFTANRKDKVFCSNDCKVKRFRITKDMKLIASFIPEEEVKAKYYVSNDEFCTFYLQWFRQGNKRFADVYASNDCNIDFEKRFKKKNIPIRTV